MIVSKYWVTEKDGKIWNAFMGNDGRYYRRKIKSWKGYFLFGIIPLYIENIEVKFK